LRHRATPFLTLIVLGLAGLAAPREGNVPSPSEFLNINVGGDGVLAGYDQIVAYWKAVDALSDRITVRELGQTTMGQPYVVGIISSPETQKRLEEYRAINNRLYDPRRTSDRKRRA